jgi:hypothetical protein
MVMLISGITIGSREVHRLNAPLPMIVQVPDITIDTGALQLERRLASARLRGVSVARTVRWNANLPICAQVRGIAAAPREPHPENSAGASGTFTVFILEIPPVLDAAHFSGSAIHIKSA